MDRFLRKDFHRVQAVCTGEEALMEIEGKFYHVIVLDINLPDMNGWEVLEHIKQHSPQSKVIMITCDDTEEMKQHAHSRGAADFLEKPFDLNALKAVLMKIFSYFDMSTKLRKTYQVLVENNHNGFTYSMSPTCMFIITDVLLETGSIIDLLLRIPGKGSIPLKGRVATVKDSTCHFMPSLVRGEWINGNSEHGFGIELIDQPPAYSFLVNSLLT